MKIDNKCIDFQDITVGILYCGDMGSAVGRLLRKAGLRVVTTCQGRSLRTREQARSSGIEILPGLDEVLAQSNVIFSLVLPAAAIDLAEKYVALHQTHMKNSIFIEANSIGLDKLEQIECLMAKHDISFVDAAIHGTANQLEDIGVLYVSGPKARYIEKICQKVWRVNWLGERIGSASKMKMIMAGISKTLAAMFLDIGVLAERAAMFEPFLKSCHHFYPGVMTAINRTLPTYTRHTPRRVSEIRNIEQMAREYSLRLGITHETGQLLKLVASIDWSHLDPGSLTDIHTIIQRVEEIRLPEN
jgi:3-hydroxyisobutyrate dehydrogenase-like beta-hydroxyacid dehydrogenase